MQNTVVIYTGLNSKKQKPQQNKHLFREYYTSSEKTKPLCSVFFFHSACVIFNLLYVIISNAFSEYPHFKRN